MSGASSAPAEPPLQLSRDETRVLEQCQRESLIYRSVPLSICTFFAAQYAMSKNIMTTKGKWIKLGAATFVGYMIGKISYTPTCRRKVLTEIPNSNLAQLIRGAETRQLSDDDGHDHQQKRTYDSNEPLVYVPDIHPVPVGVNQYGDPIYETNK